MSTSEPAVQRRSGLATVVDIVVSPSTAFAALREAPTWGWAFLIATALGIIGSLMSAPALMHALGVMLPAKLAASPQIAQLSPDQQQKQIAMIVGIYKVALGQFGFVFIPIIILVAALAQGVVLLIGDKIAHGTGSFKQYFALSVNVSAIGVGLAQVVVGIIVLVRGADSFDTPTAISGTIPGLALLAPGVHGAAGAALGVLNVFYLWATVLLALGLQRIGRVRAAAAWITAIVLLAINVAFAAGGGAQTG